MSKQSLNTIFKKKLVLELGLDKLSEAEQAKALEKIGKIIFQRLILRLAEELDAKQMADLNSAMDKYAEDSEGLIKYLNTKVPNFEQIAQEEIAGFKQEASDLFSALKTK